MLIKEIKEVISAAEEKKFSEFANKAKKSLEDKLRNNKVIKDKSSELENYENMKKIFSKISDNKDNSEEKIEIEDVETNKTPEISGEETPKETDSGEPSPE